MKAKGVQWCRDCGHRWEPCKTKACRGRGYILALAYPGGPAVLGCKACGSSTELARTWPEAHQALARALAPFKGGPTINAVLDKPLVRRFPQNGE